MNNLRQTCGDVAQQAGAGVLRMQTTSSHQPDGALRRQIAANKRKADNQTQSGLRKLHKFNTTNTSQVDKKLQSTIATDTRLSPQDQQVLKVVPRKLDQVLGRIYRCKLEAADGAQLGTNALQDLKIQKTNLPTLGVQTANRLLEGHWLGAVDGSSSQGVQKTALNSVPYLSPVCAEGKQCVAQTKFNVVLMPYMFEHELNELQACAKLPADTSNRKCLLCHRKISVDFVLCTRDLANHKATVAEDLLIQPFREPIGKDGYQAEFALAHLPSKWEGFVDHLVKFMPEYLHAQGAGGDKAVINQSLMLHNGALTDGSNVFVCKKYYFGCGAQHAVDPAGVNAHSLGTYR